MAQARRDGAHGVQIGTGRHRDDDQIRPPHRFQWGGGRRMPCLAGVPRRLAVRVGEGRIEGGDLGDAGGAQVAREDAADLAIADDRDAHAHAVCSSLQ